MPRGRKKKAPSSPKVQELKKCTRCKEEKKITDFYVSTSPLFSSDKHVPICKQCIRDVCITKEGELDEDALNKILRAIDKPYYRDLLESSYKQFLKSHPYIPAEVVSKYGENVLGIYFKNTMLKQVRTRTYSDSESEGFVLPDNAEGMRREEANIVKRNLLLNSGIAPASVDGDALVTIPSLLVDNNNEGAQSKKKRKYVRKKLTVKERITNLGEQNEQNRNYVITAIGYDPYNGVGLTEMDKGYCYNILAGYLDTDGILDDGHKLQSVIEIAMLYAQLRKVTEAMNLELESNDINETKVAKYTSTKKNLLDSINAIAKDNSISSNYSKESKAGKNTFTSKMKEMEEHGFREIEVNAFDIKTAEAFRQIEEISNTNIANQLTLDNNDYTEIVKEQRQYIQDYSYKLENLQEENRILKNDIIDLKKRVADLLGMDIKEIKTIHEMGTENDSDNNNSIEGADVISSDNIINNDEEAYKDDTEVDTA